MACKCKCCPEPLGAKEALKTAASLRPTRKGWPYVPGLLLYAALAGVKRVIDGPKR